eukprot:CAMPEP_0202890600 /NCGR_PEP_ID=MMETSP1392-20130828/946_1 /ASSEMBLY_ACC=CAM_ASM_000868 /TAXON_ID=225041 /ORGANISM="Chlamydomonas chlamydogama, Strain SAG 11-48b" /LENGTH=647 /DNA_ID=CAMNT_0049574201 /DNA_START=144 /DNA_END=2087 /DNA_ORIENTATION=+
MSLPREILKWTLSLDLSYPVKNVKRDFANGFLYAEILSRYYPADVQMHSFENVASIQRKKQNWIVLEKFFKKKRIPVERSQIDAVIAAEGDAAVEVLQAIYNFIHSPSYEASKSSDVRISPDRIEELSNPRDRGYDASSSSSTDAYSYNGQQYHGQQYNGQQQQQQQYGMQAGGMYMAGGMPMMANNGYAVAAGGYGTSAAGKGQAPVYIPTAGPAGGPSPLQEPYQNPVLQQYMAMQQQQQQQMLMQQQQQQLLMQQQQQQQQQQLYGAAGMGMGYMAQPGMGYSAAQLQQAAPAAVFGAGAQQAQQAAAAAAAAAGSAVPFARYASPGAGRYMSPLVPSTMQQQQQRGVSSVSSGPPSSSASSYQAVGPVLNQPSSNARFKSPMRAAGGYAAAAAPPPLSVPMAAGVSPTGAASMYAQQALLAQQQQMMAQQMQEQFAAQYGQVMSGGSPGRSPGAEPPEGLPYSRKPRPVDYQPYDIKDFEDKEYNIKKAGKGYWELGRLGPDLETEELQAKREKQERIKQLAAQVREDNAKKQVQAAAKPAAPKPKEPSAREKALMFAKNIPKPEPPKPSASPDAAAAAAAAAGPGRTSPGPTRGPAAGKGPGQGAAKPVAAPGSELERLEAQHNQDQARVEAIRAELARLMK